ncbi:hypothetical protein JB92DRAFT_3028719 [Gautieria morchelliformis]|nr:hypothetical protein JB92DRAFT_3028719 [Gautieria morchelliformis]
MAKKSKTKSKQVPKEWTDLFNTLSAQGIDPRSLLHTNASAAGPSPQINKLVTAATPEMTMDTSSDPPLPSNTFPSTTSMASAAQPTLEGQANTLSSDEDNDGSGSDSGEGSRSDSGDGSGSERSEGSGSDSGDRSGSDSGEGSGSDSGDGSGSDNGEGSGSNNNATDQPEAPNTKIKVTDIEFTLPDLIKRSNNGEPINVIPKPDGTGGRNFNIRMHMGLASHKSLYTDICQTVRGWCAKALDSDKAMRYQDNRKILITEANILQQIPELNFFHGAWPIRALIQQCLKNSSEQARARAHKHATHNHVILQVQPQVAGAITAPLAAAAAPIAPVVPTVVAAATAPVAVTKIKNKNKKGKQVTKENPKEIFPSKPVPVSVSLTMSKKSTKKTKKKALHASSDVQDSAASPVALVCF